MVLVLAPGAGDQLQGIKRGITELADIVVITKSDGDLEHAAARAASDYRASLHLLGARKLPNWTPPVLRASVVSGKGIDAILNEIARHRRAIGDIREARIEKEWSQLWTVLTRKHLSVLRSNPNVLAALPRLRVELENGKINIDQAAEKILQMKV